MTTHSTDLVFDETSTYIATPCPSWCTLPVLHPVDNGRGDGPAFRIHDGPTFGLYLHAYGEEYVDAPGIVHAGIEAHVEDGLSSLNALDLASLGDDTERARAWIREQVAGGNVKEIGR